LVTALLVYGCDALSRHELNQDAIVTTSALNKCSFFEPMPSYPESSPAQLEQLLFTPIDETRDLSEFQAIEEAEPDVEELASSEGGSPMELVDIEDSRPNSGPASAAAGIANEASAGCEGDLAATVSGPHTWDRIRIPTVGAGETASGGGGTDSASTYGGGGGHGQDGVAGTGAGLGTVGSFGSGLGRSVGSGQETGTGGTGTGTGKGTGSGSGNTRGAIARDVDGGAYPSRARDQNREGIVRVRVEVLEDGKTGAVELYQSSGSDDLDATALKAARKWRFQPALDEGKPVKTWVVVAVRYVLNSR
jgi:TonB family protein